MERRASPPGVSFLRRVSLLRRFSFDACPLSRILICVILSVVIITHNEESNLGRTLASVQPLVAEGKGEIIVVDSGSTDRTVDIAKSFGAKVFIEEWKGYAAQKNSAIDKAEGDWILSLDADENLEPALVEELLFLFPSSPPAAEINQRLDRVRRMTYLSTRKIRRKVRSIAKAHGDPGSIFVGFTGFLIPRKNFFLGRWIKHGGFWPDPKLRLFKNGMARFEDRLVHEDACLIEGISPQLNGALIHHSYPTLTDYIDHMNRYSSLGAEMAFAKGQRGFSLFNIVLRPLATFIYNYIFRRGFLDGREGLLLHLYHAVYVSWKYSKTWELGRKK
jgi:glycosyltransferase involved in cell wall biosynthesis